MLQSQRCRKISGILDRIVEKEGRLKRRTCANVGTSCIIVKEVVRIFLLGDRFPMRNVGLLDGHCDVVGNLNFAKSNIFTKAVEHLKFRLINVFI